MYGNTSAAGSFTGLASKSKHLNGGGRSRGGRARSAPTNAANRYNLLLLEDGVYFFEDFGVYRFPTPESGYTFDVCMERKVHLNGEGGDIASARSSIQPLSFLPTTACLLAWVGDLVYNCHAVHSQVQGRLKICSRCIVFVPQDSSLPVCKMPFAKMDVAPQPFILEGGDSPPQQMDLFMVKCAEVVHTKENGAISPYISVKTNDKGMEPFSSYLYACIHSDREKVLSPSPPSPPSLPPYACFSPPRICPLSFFRTRLFLFYFAC